MNYLAKMYLIIFGEPGIYPKINGQKLKNLQQNQSNQPFHQQLAVNKNTTVNSTVTHSKKGVGLITKWIRPTLLCERFPLVSVDFL